MKGIFHNNFEKVTLGNIGGVSSLSTSICQTSTKQINVKTTMMNSMIMTVIKIIDDIDDDEDDDDNDDDDDDDSINAKTIR